MKQALMILLFYRITKVKLLILKNKLRNRIPVGHKTNRGEDYNLDRAIDACLKVREHIRNLPSSETGLNYTPQVAIGINSGELIAGNIGSASLKRLDFTVVGDVVNTAQRLQSAAKAGQIVISEIAYEQVKESFNCAPLSEVSLKNKANHLNIYEVLD